MTRSRIGRLIATLAIPVFLTACSSGGGPLPTVPPITPAPPTPAATHPGPTYQPGCPKSQPDALAAGQTRTVTIQTDKGSIAITIHADWSPIAAGNFVTLVSCGYYDSVVFHRVVSKFVIQGGDGMFGRSPDLYPDLVGSGGVPYTIKDEPVTQTYHRGTVAMARTAQPNSVTSQFFIVLDDSAAGALAATGRNNYQIIGEVTSGMDVADKITAAADKEIPTNPVVMTKVTVSNP